MDLDAFLTTHADEWFELESLLKVRRPTPEQTDRMIDLYQRAGTHLSVLRSTAPDPELVQGLSGLVSRARRRIGSARTLSWRAFREFFTDTLPGALYRMRWWWLTTMVVGFGIAVAMAVQMVLHPSLENVLGTPGMIQNLVNRDFEGYYHESPAAVFAAQVWTHNALLTALCVACGVLGLPTAQMLFDNSLNLGLMAGIMINHHKGWLFFSLVVPHGLLELTALFVGAGAGFKLFWSWVNPGNRTRLASMAHEGRSTLTITMGLAVVLLVTGIIEGFVTPSGLPGAARIVIGLVVWVGFLVYALGWGRIAHRRGADGDVGVDDRGEDEVAAA